MRTLLFSAAIGTAMMTALAGCGGKADKVSAVGPEARQAISQAAVARYPGNARTSSDVQLTAINYPGKQYLEIHNTGSQSLPAATVWVNGTFLTVIDGIAPQDLRHRAARQPAGGRPGHERPAGAQPAHRPGGGGDRARLVYRAGADGQAVSRDAPRRDRVPRGGMATRLAFRDS
jgi:hypothetical protein